MSLNATASATTMRLAIDTVRTLSMDAVQQANSGHPGTPMALAPLAYALFTRHLRHDPKHSHWPDRDRFVLSVGHASMVLYSSLHLSGYDLSLDDIKAFRQWGSKTPGHPEHGHTDGVETTTGPLGQGLANAVGFALSERHLAAQFNRPGHDIVDHYTYFIAGDGDLMEGISHEASSFAGHFKLGKLIGFFDDNRITIDGRTDLTCSDDVAKRFTAYGWQVLHITDVNDQDAIDRAIAEAKSDPHRPSMIITRTIIGFGSPNREDTSKAHGEPLGVAEIELTKDGYGWPTLEPFHVPLEAAAHWKQAAAERAKTRVEWLDRWHAYVAQHPTLASELTRRMSGDLPEAWAEALPRFNAANGSMASRAASGAVLAAIATAVPELLGGSADLTGSNLTQLKGEALFSAEVPAGRYVHYGIREHAMGAIMNGVALHGGNIPYGGTFLIFSDYMRPAIRLAALMKQRVIYVFTHDSIGLGEDGPTHQPVESLSALRCIPGLTVIRPADAAEVVDAWRLAINHRNGPVALVLSRQSLPWLDIAEKARMGVSHGAYLISQSSGGQPQIVLMASGSEVSVALNAASTLESRGVRVRVVSAPSLELFAAQDKSYQDHLLPEGVPRVAIEAAHPMSWYRWVGSNGAVVGIETFGASAPASVLFREYGITSTHIVDVATGLLGG